MVGILAYLPIVGPIMMTVFPFVFDEKFGRTSALEQILTALLPFIYLAYSSYFR